MKSETLKQLVVAQLAELKAQGIATLDISKLTTIADYFIIACGTSRRHRQAIAERVMEIGKSNGVKVRGCEGFDAAEWILIDFGDVVLHVMQQETRTRYNLEGLWQDTKIFARTEHATN